MNFQLFIYYCALSGGWAAFLAWSLIHSAGANGTGVSPYAKAGAIGALLGGCVAAAVSIVDGLLNDKGMQRLARAAASGLLGAIAGAIGSLAATALFHFLSVPRFLGWMLVGTLVGASLGLFDVFLALTGKASPSAARRKVANGLMGGLVGGLVGGLPYGFLDGNVSLPRSGLTMGLVVLGTAIGLSIGLAQVILKEAWLKVVEGFRPGRELMLSKDETTIGRAETCDLGLFGDNTIERIHARIARKDDRYVLSHVAEQGQTFLNGVPVGGRPAPLRAGDEIQVGKSVLQFGERQKRK